MTCNVVPEAHTHTAKLIFFIILLAASWTFSTGGLNQISRYDAICAFWENTGSDRHTFRIDAFMQAPEQNYNTIDWSYKDGHYYSNKSPGTTIFGAAVYAPLYFAGMKIFGRGFPEWYDFICAWLINAFLTALPAAFGGACLYSILKKSGVSELKSTFFTLLGYFGTGLLPYSAQLWAHTSVAAFLVTSLYFAMTEKRWRLFASGAFFGLAVLFDYSAGMLFPAVAAALIYRERKDLLQIWKFIAGGLIFAITYLVYNRMCFGGFFTFAFSCINPAFAGTEQESMLFLPKGQVALELLFGEYRGMIPVMPFLVFAVSGFIETWKEGKEKRLFSVFLAASFLSVFLMNASFNGWFAGKTSLARYLIPVFPALIILCAFSPLKTAWSRLVFFAFAALSIVNTGVILWATPLAAEPFCSPVYEASYKCLSDGTHFIQNILKCHRMTDAWLSGTAGCCSIGELCSVSRTGSFIILYAVSAILSFLAIDAKAAKSYAAVTKEKIASAVRNLNCDLWLTGAAASIATALITCGEAPLSASAKNVLSSAMGCNARNALSPDVPTLFYQVFSVISCDVMTLAVVKTAFSLAVTVFAVKRIFEKNFPSLSWHVPVFMVTVCPPALFFAHRNLSPVLLMLPLAALCIMAALDFLRTKDKKSFCIMSVFFIIGIAFDYSGSAIPCALVFTLIVTLIKKPAKTETTALIFLVFCAAIGLCGKSVISSNAMALIGLCSLTLLMAYVMTIIKYRIFATLFGVLVFLFTFASVFIMNLTGPGLAELDGMAHGVNERFFCAKTIVIPQDDAVKTTAETLDFLVKIDGERRKRSSTVRQEDLASRKTVTLLLKQCDEGNGMRRLELVPFERR